MRDSTIQKIQDFLSGIDAFVFTDEEPTKPYIEVTGTDQYDNLVIERFKIEDRKVIFYPTLRNGEIEK